MKVFKLLYPRCMDFYSYHDRTLIYNISLLNYLKDFCFVMHCLDDINSIVSFIRYILIDLKAAIS